MNNSQKLSSWLDDRRRTYADGLVLFRRLARKPVQDLFLAYLTNGEDAARTAQLEACLRRLRDNIKAEPQLYPDAFKEYEGSPSAPSPQAIDREIVRRVTQIAEHDSQLESLRSAMVEMTQRNEDNEADYAALQADIAGHEEAIRQLQAEVEELRKPGVKFVRTEECPVEIRMAQTRVKEIVPLMASLHADLSDTTLTDAKRKTIADQLCRLSDERHELWQKIDRWSQEGTPADTTDPVQEGYRIARRIERLQANIIYARQAADDAAAAGRQTIQDNALRRLEKYQRELQQLREAYQSE